MLRGSEPSEEADAPGASHPAPRVNDSGERPYLDIQESGFDENAANDGSRRRDTTGVDEDDEQEQLLAHFEQQNSLTLQMIKQDQKRGPAGHPQVFTKHNAPES